ncbi:sorting nexin-15 [Protopterus annectens]|uniref:sorting nexin-15 n=1 Tax=Protopterus annectens TaxID=7888 RepID=UPI001CFB7D9C|nr:sorting nexin-15 [Protopterus annectens]
MSRRAKEEYNRFYTVTDHRTHEKGYTEYKVTAKIVSKKNPDECKQIVVWKRYSDFKKLHNDLSYIHRNLFRGTEEFPPFPKAQVFGRFDAAVIEERRSSAENLLKFTVNIPALSNSPQLKEFFKGADSQKSSASGSSDVQTLPPPLVPVPMNASKKDEQHDNLQPFEYSEHLPTLEGCEELYDEEPETAVSALDDFLDEFMSDNSCEKEEEEMKNPEGTDAILSNSCVAENNPTVACHVAEAERDDKLARFDPWTVSGNNTFDKKFEDLKRLRIKETSLFYDIRLLEKYVELSITPRGLRIDKLPAFKFSEDKSDYLEEWKAVSLQCTLSWIKILIKRNRRSLGLIQAQIAEGEASLSNEYPNTAFITAIKDINDEVSKVECNVIVRKKKKLNRDVSDFKEFGLLLAA